MSIVDYIIEHKRIPQDDFLWQININFRQPKSFQVPMIYPQNVYILFASIAMVTWLWSKIVFDLLSIGIILISWIFFYAVTVQLTNKKSIWYLATVLYFLLPFRYRIVIRRIIEPMSLLFALTVLYLLMKWVVHKSSIYPILVWFFLFILFYTKQSNLYFIVIIGIYSIFLRWSVKEVVLMWVSFLFWGLPALWYSYGLLWSISPTPPWIPFIDTTLLNPWWEKQKVQEREWALNENVYNTKIKKITYNQFIEDIQVSPSVYAQEGKYGKVVQNFLPLQIHTEWTQWYHLPLSKSIAHFNLLLFLFWCIACIVYFKKDKKYTTFALLSIVVVIVFSLKFTVFRYYINSVVLNSILFAYGLYILRKKGNLVSSLLLCLVGVVFSTITIISSLSKNVSYANSIGHRLTNTTWWLAELVALWVQTETIFTQSWEVFTPVLEVAYYLHKRVYRDEKFFFIQDKQDLIYYLHKAWIGYVLNPFYSNLVPWSRWKYYDGIPSDSLFGKMLKKEECFTRVYDAVSFDLYVVAPPSCAGISDAQIAN